MKIYVTPLPLGDFYALQFDGMPERMRGEGELFEASNGVWIWSHFSPDWGAGSLNLPGTDNSLDTEPVLVPADDLPRIKAALMEWGKTFEDRGDTWEVGL